MIAIAAPSPKYSIDLKTISDPPRNVGAVAKPRLRSEGSKAWSRDLTARIQMACIGHNAAEIGGLTGTNPETARRYMRGLGPPSCAFLSALCQRLGYSPNWMLCGQGTPSADIGPK